MCLPAIAAPIIALIGTAASATGTVIQGVGAANAGAASEAAGKRNQNLADFAAEDALERGGSQVGQVRSQGSRIIGAERTAYAASGVDSSKGSAADVQAETRGYSEIDAQVVKANAAREAYGLRTQGAQLAEQGRQEAAAGMSSFYGSLFSAGGQVASGAVGAYRAGQELDLFGRPGTAPPPVKAAPTPGKLPSGKTYAPVLPPPRGLPRK